MNCLRRFLTSCDGATAVEYCVMLALIFLTLLIAVMTIGLESNDLWQRMGGKLDEAGAGK